MSSTYTVPNLNITGDLQSPFTDKGTILAHNGTKTFEKVTPSTNCQVLTADSAQSSGVSWSATSQNAGFSIVAKNLIIPDEGSFTNYIVNQQDSPGSRPVVLPASQMIYFTFNTNNSGYVTSNLANITNSTTWDFYLGFMNSAEQPTLANFKYYGTGTTTKPGSPDFQITSDTIKANIYSTFTSTAINYTITSGQQVTMRFENNFTHTMAPPSYGVFSSLLIFKGT